jgi:Protein of unknown function (DUF3618)
MTTPAEPKISESGTDLSTDKLEADIERTREELGQTVDALSQKFDVKAQARHKVAKVKDKPKAVAFAAGGLVVALGTVAAVVMRGRPR